MDENMFNKIKLWSTNDKMSHQNKFHLMNIILISLVLLISQTIYYNSSGMPNEHILLFDYQRSYVNLIHQACDECISFF